MRHWLTSVHQRHPLERSVETDVHEGPSHGVAGEGEGEEVGDDVASLTGESVDVDDDGVHDEEGEPGEEVEAEEDDVGGRRGTEEEGEGVHPGSEGHTVGDEEEDNGREDSWV